MRDIRTLLMVLLVVLVGLAVTALPISNIIGATVAQAQDDDWGDDEWDDDWDDWEEEEEEEDAFGNIMETTFSTIESTEAGAPLMFKTKINLHDEEEEATISEVYMGYSVDGGAVQEVKMSDNGGGVFSANILSPKKGSKIKYFYRVIDSNNNTTTGALPGQDNMVAGVDDTDNSEDIVGDNADLLGLSVGYDDTYLYVNFDVQGEIDGGTIDPPYIQLYGIKITNPDTEQGEGLMVGKLWVYLPLAKDEAVQEKFMPMLLEQGQEYIEKIGQENIDRVMETGMMVLDIQKLMGGNIMEGLLFKAEPEATIDGGKLMGKVKRAALGDNPSGYLRIITLTAANASIDSFMPIPLNCSNFITLYTSNYEMTVN